MLSPTPALPVGPYDWRPESPAQVEFEGRLAAARRVLIARGLAGLIVHGSTLDDSALAWLTGFTPKLGPAFALIPAEGQPRILFSGGQGMAASARRLTWIADVRPLGALLRDMQAWRTDVAPREAAPIGLYGADALAESDFDQLRRAVGDDERLIDCSPDLDAMRRKKTEFELSRIRACALLAERALERLTKSLAAGSSRRAAALDAERDAYANGAQDVRILCSARPGGVPTTLEASVDSPTAPLNLYLAVRRELYWADRHAAIGPEALRDLARGALGCMAAELRPGARLLTSAAAVGVGAGQMERPRPPHDALAQGDVVSVCARVPVRDMNGAAFESALFAIVSDGAVRLSPGLEATR